MTTFEPRLDILSSAQRQLWPQLAPLQSLGFVLYGETAIALQLGHRPSVDFDFFCDHPLDQRALFDCLPFLQNSLALKSDHKDTLLVTLPTRDSTVDSVKLSFFGGIDIGRVGDPKLTADQIMQVASLDDLMATKLKVIMQRVEYKDYIDIVSMIKAGVSLSHGLSAARQLYGPQFQPSESLKALVYFKGGDLHLLSQDDRSVLCQTASAINERPQVKIKSASLSL
jgi:hypothetical protein